MNEYKVEFRGSKKTIEAAMCTFESNMVVFKDTKGKLLEAYPTRKIHKVSML